jgi:hypothetical protein
VELEVLEVAVLLLLGVVLDVALALVLVLVVVEVLVVDVVCAPARGVTRRVTAASSTKRVRGICRPALGFGRFAVGVMEPASGRQTPGIYWDMPGVWRSRSRGECGFWLHPACKTERVRNRP